MADPFVGTELKATFTFENEAGTPTDPTTITAKTKRPDGTGTVTTYVYPTAGMAKVSTGIYTLVWTPDVGGFWHVRAEGTGAVKAAEEAVVKVNAGAF